MIFSKSNIFVTVDQRMKMSAIRKKIFFFLSCLFWATIFTFRKLVWTVGTSITVKSTCFPMVSNCALALVMSLNNDRNAFQTLSIISLSLFFGCVMLAFSITKVLIGVRLFAIAFVLVSCTRSSA
jgi:hypothetical protein